MKPNLYSPFESAALLCFVLMKTSTHGTRIRTGVTMPYAKVYLKMGWGVKALKFPKL